ncbi:phage tail tube assembly chaperone [Oenococcus sicerae]|uniref:phage tail tube assembly chaperone n=1 Tax=Oenococcus sicerae TaxID=2203724 RepID=UPI0039ED2A7D
MLLTIRVPELNNKEFSFKDSTKNLKIITRLMKKSFQDQVDGQAQTNVSEADQSSLSPEELADFLVKQNQDQIKAFDNELKSIDSVVDSVADIFGLDQKDHSQIEELSLNEIGQLIAHISFRLNNPDLSEDEYQDLITTGDTKKLQPDKG